MVFKQIQSSIAPTSADPSGFWHDCRLNHGKCTPAQLRFLQGCSIDHKNLWTSPFKASLYHSNRLIFYSRTGFREQMLRVVKGFSMSRQNGLFINSCFAHCQTERQDTWFADDSPVIRKKVKPHSNLSHTNKVTHKESLFPLSRSWLCLWNVCRRWQ